MKQVIARFALVVLATATAMPILGISRAEAHDFANDADGHVHVAGVVQGFGRCGILLSGANTSGVQTNPANYDYSIPATVANPGNSPDHQWVQDADASPLVFDMGSNVVNVLLFPSIDHGPDVRAEALESTVYGGPTVAGPWTAANLITVFDQGFDAAWVSDDYASMWMLPTASRYVAVGWGGPGAELADGDDEIDALCAATDIQPRSVEGIALQFSQICGPGPNPPAANANAAHFTFEGTFNGTPGYQLEVRLTDYGEPGKDSDAIRMELHRPGDGLVVYDSLLSGDFPETTPRLVAWPEPTLDISWTPAICRFIRA